MKEYELAQEFHYTLDELDRFRKLDTEKDHKRLSYKILTTTTDNNEMSNDILPLSVDDTRYQSFNRPPQETTKHIYHKQVGKEIPSNAIPELSNSIKDTTDDTIRKFSPKVTRNDVIVKSLITDAYQKKKKMRRRRRKGRRSRLRNRK